MPRANQSRGVAQDRGRETNPGCRAVANASTPMRASHAMTLSLVRLITASCMFLLACADDAPDRPSQRTDARVMPERDAAAPVSDAAVFDAMWAADSDAGPDSSVVDASDEPLAALSKRAACIRFVEAQCSRTSHCGFPIYPPDCLIVANQCPDLLFSPGSTRNPDVLAACAANDWPSFSCTTLSKGQLPACVTAGTRTAGEACAFNSQCASLNCSVSGLGCGTCLERVGDGQPCRVQGNCAIGLSCVADRCVEALIHDEKNGAAPKNQPCVDECERGYSCQQDASSATGKRCLVGSVGMPCRRSNECPIGQWCSCNGESCGIAPSAAGSCMLKPAAGQRCLGNGDWVTTCALDAYCDPKARVDCLPRGAVGATCDRSEACLEGLICVEDRCLVERDEGESCGGPTDYCTPGTRCEQETCRALDTRHVFEETCNP